VLSSADLQRGSNVGRIRCNSSLNENQYPLILNGCSKTLHLKLIQSVTSVLATGFEILVACSQLLGIRIGVAISTHHSFYFSSSSNLFYSDDG